MTITPSRRLSGQRNRTVQALVRRLVQTKAFDALPPDITILIDKFIKDPSGYNRLQMYQKLKTAGFDLHKSGLKQAMGFGLSPKR